ncbi:MAG TPA: hypothetical protein VIG88_01300 [Lysobacter sp.]
MHALRRHHFHAILLPLALLAVGCAAVSASTRDTAGATKANWEWPLRFSKHAMRVACYDTIGCRARYADVWQVYDAPDYRRPSSASIGPNYRDHMRGGHIAIVNFPEPMEITWRSKDGTPLQARIDIGRIFQDELVRHNVPRERIPLDVTSLAPDTVHPDIVVEVNDRIVRVYMRSHIPVDHETKPGNRFSRFVSELIEVETFHF